MHVSHDRPTHHQRRLKGPQGRRAPEDVMAGPLAARLGPCHPHLAPSSPLRCSCPPTLAPTPPPCPAAPWPGSSATLHLLLLVSKHEEERKGCGCGRLGMPIRAPDPPSSTRRITRHASLLAPRTSQSRGVGRRLAACVRAWVGWGCVGDGQRPSPVCYRRTSTSSAWGSRWLLEPPAVTLASAVVELGWGEEGLRRAEVPQMRAWDACEVCGVELDAGEVPRANAPCRGATCTSLRAGSPIAEPAEAVVRGLLLLLGLWRMGGRWAAREQVRGMMASATGDCGRVSWGSVVSQARPCTASHPAARAR
jgi:hypothetical protein